MLQRVAGVAGLIPAGVWIYLLAGRGGFWRVRDDGHSCEPGTSRGRVAVKVPARNEAAVVHQAITSLLEQDYAGEIAIFVVDDHSSDNTSVIARRAADRARLSERLAVLRASSLPHGWTGKLWALSARRIAPLNAGSGVFPVHRCRCCSRA